MKTFQALALILNYPDIELQRAVPELMQVFADEKLIGSKQLQALDLFLTRFAEEDLLDLQEQYVLNFDRTRSLSLHLFEHVHGQSRDRGQALVDLRQQYLDTGMEVISDELPDFLPMFLEYLSLLPLDDAKHQLSLCLPIISALGERLRSRNSGYAAAFAALVGIADGKPDPEVLKMLLAQAVDNPQDHASVDQAWEESAVRFRADHPDPTDMIGAREIPIRIETGVTDR